MPRKFSGTAIVEIPNIARRFDWPMIWGFSHDYWMEHGDAWVQIGMPQSVASMKKFDAARYGSMSFDNTTKVCPGETEDGLRYDMLSQVAAAIKSKAAGMPLAGPQRAARVSQHAGHGHDHLHQRDSQPGSAGGRQAHLRRVFDQGSERSGRHQFLRAALAATDPRRMLKAVDVPTIVVMAQGEVEAHGVVAFAG